MKKAAPNLSIERTHNGGAQLRASATPSAIEGTGGTFVNPALSATRATCANPICEAISIVITFF